MSTSVHSDDAKAAIMQYIENRLNEWAAWFRRRERLGIGYPPCSVEYRMMTEGYIPREYIGQKPLPTNEAAEEMEYLITAMAIQNHKMAEILRKCYLLSGGIREKAKHIGMSTSQIEVHLQSARWWLAGRLTLDKQIEILIYHFKRIKKRQS